MPSKEQASVQSVTVDTSSVPNLQDMSQIVNQNGYNTTCYGTYTTAKTTHACQPPPEKLAHLPYPETNENILKLKQYILDQFFSSAFNTSSPFPAMNTTPVLIHLKPDASPYATHTHQFPFYITENKKSKRVLMLMYRKILLNQYP